ncbi:MAG: D-aminoacyl-tRNA deacylase [Candidatus Helarchaeota archaeon]
MPDIIISSKDLAGQSIFKQLTENFGFKKINKKFEGNDIWTKNEIRLITTNRELLYCDHLDILRSDLLIFGSQHKSESGRPSLLVHCTGNWGDNADYGGRPNEIAFSSGSAMKTALIELKNQKEQLELDDFDVSLEVTHHGPTQLDTPLVFIELGSTPKEWKNAKGALAVSYAIIKVAESKKVYKNYIGIGGPHYAQKFSKVVGNPDINFTVSHIIPKYFIDSLSKKMISECIKKSKEPIEAFVFDWKGTNSIQRKKIIPFIESLNYKYKKIKDFERNF